MQSNKSYIKYKSKDYIIKILLHGNVGNHLFQFAAGLNALKNKKDLRKIIFFDTKEMSFKISNISIFNFIKNLNKISYKNLISFKFKKFLF